MMRKPISIILLSILFLLSPAAILVFNAAVNMVPLFGYGSILYRLSPQDLLILTLYPLSGISIFLVRKWGWWVLICSASLMFLYNISALYYNPFSSVLIVVLMNAIIFSVALFFFRKHLIAPYFHPRLRWWEQDQRYEIDIYMKFLEMDRNVIISDISEGGCYIFGNFQIENGAEYAVMIVCGSFHIKLNVTVMRTIRVSEQYLGYGLMFQKIDVVQRSGLEELLDKLKSFSGSERKTALSNDKRLSTRFFIGNDLSLQYGKSRMAATLSDISKSGCSLLTSVDVPGGENCLFHFIIKQESFFLESSVVWKKCHDENYVYGLKFSAMGSNEKKALKYLINTVKRLGAGKRETDLADYYRQCDEEALTTPYRIIDRIRELTALK